MLFIAVGTPPSADGSADLSHVVAVAEMIAAQMRTPKIVVMKSTVPVGTNDKVREILTLRLKAAGLSELGFDVVSNPEFLREGSVCFRFHAAGRLSGTYSDNLRDDREIYAPSTAPTKDIVRSAKCRLTSRANAMLATSISL